MVKSDPGGSMKVSVRERLLLVYRKKGRGKLIH